MTALERGERARRLFDGRVGTVVAHRHGRVEMEFTIAGRSTRLLFRPNEIERVEGDPEVEEIVVQAVPTPWLDDGDVQLYHGDVREQLERLPAGIARTCVTSPPYWGLRDYGVEGQIGAEATPDEYVARMVDVFRAVRRVLADDGTLWLNLGDTYVTAKGQSGGVDPKQPARRHGIRPNDVRVPGLKPKDLVGIPWRVALALQADGWYLRSDIIWAKPNPMPSPAEDRPTCSHEYLFLLAKSRIYHYDHVAVAEPAVAKSLPGTNIQQTQHYGGMSGGNKGLGAWAERHKAGDVSPTRNRRSVWHVPTTPYPGAHFATFPPALIEPCILAGAEPGDVVLDPFSGSGTTAWTARNHGRRAIGVELNEEYLRLASDRLSQQSLLAEDGT